MRFTNIVIAAFVALSQFAIAAPIDTEALEARTKPKTVLVPVVDNDNNAIIYGSGNGGNGGTNYAVPIAVAGSKSSTKGQTKGPVVVVSAAGNEVGQEADGGDGSAVGSYGSNNHFARGVKPVVVPVYDNNNNAIIVGSGNGGNGGVNYAAPVALAGSSSSTKGKTGWVAVGSLAGNAVGQSANGGDGSVVGTYGSNNHFARGNPKPVVIPVVGNDNNAIIANSGNGGNGGKNIAVPVALAGSKSSTEGKTGGVVVSSVAGNIVGQSADGGDGTVVGTYGEHNHFARTNPKPVVIPVLSDNDNNAVIIGSGNGGNGGTNVAVPIAVAASGSTSKGHSGSISVGTGAGNIVGQSANGGDGSAVGSYGSNNHF